MLEREKEITDDVKKNVPTDKELDRIVKIYKEGEVVEEIITTGAGETIQALEEYRKQSDNLYTGQSSLIERLRSVDKDAWAEVTNPSGFSYHMKIGMLVHQAIDELELHVGEKLVAAYKLHKEELACKMNNERYLAKIKG